MHAGGISLLSAVSMDPRYTYLLINLGSILVPFIASFEPRLRFLPAMEGAVARAADHPGLLHRLGPLPGCLGRLGFQSKHVLGIYWWGLPMEEWLFSSPYLIPACSFTLRSTTSCRGNPLAGNARNITGAWVCYPPVRCRPWLRPVVYRDQTDADRGPAGVCLVPRLCLDKIHPLLPRQSRSRSCW